MSNARSFFDWNTNGWSIVAVKAPFEQVATELRNAAGTLSFHDNVTPTQVIVKPDLSWRMLDGSDINISLMPDRRSVAILQPVRSDWPILLRSANFVYMEDIEWADDVAKWLSEKLATVALACCGETICRCLVFEQGRKINELNDIEPAEAAALFDDLQISVPNCMAGSDPPQIVATEQVCREIERAALLEVLIPSEST